MYSETDYPRNLYKSTNSGDTWSNISPTFTTSQTELDVMPLSISPTNENDILLGADRVYISHDAGNSWSPISPVWSSAQTNDDSVTTIAPTSRNSSTIYIGTTGGEIHKMTDGGTNEGVYASAWGGNQWRPVGKGLPNYPVTNVLFSQGRMYISTNGRGIWSMALPQQLSNTG